MVEGAGPTGVGTVAEIVLVLVVLGIVWWLVRGRE